MFLFGGSFGFIDVRRLFQGRKRRPWISKLQQIKFIFESFKEFRDYLISTFQPPYGFFGDALVRRHYSEAYFISQEDPAMANRDDKVYLFIANKINNLQQPTLRVKIIRTSGRYWQLRIFKKENTSSPFTAKPLA